MRLTLPILAAGVLAAFAVAPALGQDVTITTCDGAFTYAEAPTRAITLNQQATEIMLALGLEDRMIGTAYLDDAIPEQWRAAYEQIPVLSDEYPAREVVLAADPDFLFAGFRSAFAEDALGAESEWHAIGIGTYLPNTECRDQHPADAQMTTEPLFIDLETIGRAFGVEDRANEIIADFRARLEDAVVVPPEESLVAFVYDSGTDTAYSSACCGAPALLVRSVGLTNMTDDIEGRWADVAWEAVVAADPDVIVLVDAEWSTAEEKIAHLKADPVLSELDAVANDRFLTVGFSETVLGMRFVEGVESLSAQLAALDL